MDSILTYVSPKMHEAFLAGLDLRKKTCHTQLTQGELLQMIRGAKTAPQKAVQELDFDLSAIWHTYTRDLGLYAVELTRCSLGIQRNLYSEAFKHLIEAARYREVLGVYQDLILALTEDDTFPNFDTLHALDEVAQKHLRKVPASWTCQCPILKISFLDMSSWTALLCYDRSNMRGLDSDLD